MSSSVGRTRTGASSRSPTVWYACDSFLFPSPFPHLVFCFLSSPSRSPAALTTSPLSQNGLVSCVRCVCCISVTYDNLYSLPFPSFLCLARSHVWCYRSHEYHRREGDRCASRALRTVIARRYAALGFVARACAHAWVGRATVTVVVVLVMMACVCVVCYVRFVRARMHAGV